MPRHQPADGVAKGPQVERTLDPGQQRNVVDGRLGGELGQEPEALLGEGQRRLADPGTRARGRRRNRDRPAAAQPGRQVAQGRVLEDGADADLESQGAAQARRGPRGEERMAAEGEEVGAGGEPAGVNLKHLRPGGPHRLLDVL